MDKDLIDSLVDDYEIEALIDRVEQLVIKDYSETVKEDENSKKELNLATELEKNKVEFYCSKCTEGPLPEFWTSTVLKAEKDLKLLKYDYAKACKAAAKWKKRAKEFERHNKLLIEHNDVLEYDIEIIRTLLKQEQDKNMNKIMPEQFKEFSIEKNDALRSRSGTIRIKGKLADFLYTLLRDHLPASKVEELVRDAEYSFEKSDEPNLYSNGWLALYAQDLATRLT